MLAEANVLGPQESLSLHLREASGLVDPRKESEDAGEFCQSVLTPARSGMILTRADLTKVGRKHGMGLRMGERKFILKALLAQDASAIFDWLIEEATVWTKHHQEHGEVLCGISRAWEEKSKAAASLFKELKTAAQEIA